MYPRRALIVAGVLAFLLSLTFLAPARYLVRLVPATAGHVSDVTGTLWQGSAKLSLPRAAFNVSWDSHPARILLLSLACDWTLAGDDLGATGTASWSPWGSHVQVTRGQLGPNTLSRLMTGTQATLDQPLMLQSLDMDLAGGRVKSASGRLAWGPGTIRLASRPDPLSLPALHGVLRQEDGKLRLLVDGEAEPGAPLATLDLDLAANEVHAVVTQRAARLAGLLPGTAATAPDSSFFELRQPLH